MNLCLMFHKAVVSRYGNTLDIFEEIFDYLSSKNCAALPGEKKKRLSYTLTFDDATYDFYLFIYPLLKKYNLQAVLAVPIEYIPDTCSKPKGQRVLEVKKDLDITKLEKSAFCSWEEIQEMLKSNHVMIASHSMTHKNLTSSDVDLISELKTSKQILEQKLNIVVNTFIAPYGKINKNIVKLAKRYYKYVYRVGSALNYSWNQQMLYRVPCDQLEESLTHFKMSKTLKYFGKSILNKVRGY